MSLSVTKLTTKPRPLTSKSDCPAASFRQDWERLRNPHPAGREIKLLANKPQLKRYEQSPWTDDLFEQNEGQCTINVILT